MLSEATGNILDDEELINEENEVKDVKNRN